VETHHDRPYAGLHILIQDAKGAEMASSRSRTRQNEKELNVIES
jgi:hypothetical protein